jgi:hypothetical protein
MGIDYRANFGLGYKIESPINESDENTHRHTPDGVIDNMFDFSRYVRSSSKYLLLETGCAYDDNTDWYVFIKNPFDCGLDLTKEVEELTEYCKNMGFKTVGQFDCHGGLRIS